MSWLKKIFRAKSREPKGLVQAKLSTKSFNLGSFTEFLSAYGHSDLAAHTTVLLYDKTAPLANSVDIISSEFSSLRIVVKDPKNNDEIVPDHPVLDLLSNPNADSSQDEFLYFLCAFLLITGNSYLVATGQVNREPLEIWPVYPQQVQIQPNTRDGYAEKLNVSGAPGSSDYKREEVDSRWRFYFKDEREIWHIKSFNPNTGVLTGQTPVSAILPEIDQYNYSGTHNTSLLKRGARPSGILLASSAKSGGDDSPEPLTDLQYQRIKEQFNRFISGAENAGRAFIAEGANIDYKDMLVSNRDMDFIEGRRDVRNTIYNRYRIPLPFVSPERQTFANMETAGIQLHSNAVAPVSKRLLNELTLFLMPRYKNSENLFLDYDRSQIQALRLLKAKETKEKQGIGIYTIDELRAMEGMEPLESGGNQVYIPANLVPIGADRFTEDQPAVPQKTSKKQFSEIMKSKGYSGEKIQEMAIVLNLK